jgi:hypothetical protein
MDLDEPYKSNYEKKEERMLM